MKLSSKVKHEGKSHRGKTKNFGLKTDIYLGKNSQAAAMSKVEWVGRTISTFKIALRFEPTGAAALQTINMKNFKVLKINTRNVTIEAICLSFKSLCFDSSPCLEYAMIKSSN
jgi:hypothetical protein